MCGITGIHRSKGLNSDADDAIKRMISSLLHRGPDESGVYIDDQTALGHTRLSIIDPRGGSQPITNEDQTLWIVFNGEVFNYPDIRADLIRSGHIFKTNCDTEVLLHLFEEKREKCLEIINGQYAFAIWDSANEELFLARDRAGIAPLFYTQTSDGKFIFGSEIKAIFAEGSVNRNLSQRSIEQIFTLWTTIPGQTVFEGINELPPASYIRVKNGLATIKKYWDVNYEDTASEMNYSLPKIVDEVRAILLDSVRIRLRADVPVGCYLSGGLDSSGVTALIHNNFNNDLRTFGITFEDQNFNEQVYQQTLVKSLGVNHTEEFVSNDAISEYFTDIIYHTEKPILRTAPVPLYLLSKRVRQEGYKVVLSGEGADEIFGGYNIFKEALIRKFWSDYPSSAKRHLLLSRLYPYIFKDKRLQSSLTEFFKTGIDDPKNPFFSHQIRWKNTSKIISFFADGVREKNYNPVDYLDAFLPESFGNWSTLGRAQYIEFLLFMSGYLLSSQGDRMAMANSVELRIPFLDHRLIEYMAKIPSSLKIRGLNEKFILKKIFEKELPKQITSRPKNPFRAPINYLFNGSTTKNLDYVSPEAVKESGLFNYNKVAMLVKKLNNGSGSEVDNMAAAGILSTQVIYYKFIKDFNASSQTPVYVNNYFDFRKKLENYL